MTAIIETEATDEETCAFSAKDLQLSDTTVTEEFTVGAICVLDRTGDTRHMWDSRNKSEVKAAKALFDSLRSEGYMVYKAEGKDGSRGEVMHEFDKRAERLIAVKQLVGG